MRRPLLVPILALPLLAACTTVEGTGRAQLNMYSPDEEAALGDDAFAQLMKGAKLLPASDPRSRRVQAIGRRIEAAARERTPNMAARMRWSWTVADDPGMVNAWMLPGGRACVYTGMLDFVRSDDELAVVMGHEASHAIARHGTERMTQGGLLSLGVATVGATTGSGAAQETSSMLAEMLVARPHSRDQESEADELGLLIAAQAGYDPHAAITLWQRMQARGGSPPEFLSTHPSEATRLERLQAIMPKADAIWRRASGAAPAPAPTSAGARSPPR